MKASEHNIGENVKLLQLMDSFVDFFFNFLSLSFIFSHFYSFFDCEEVHLPMNNQVDE